MTDETKDVITPVVARSNVNQVQLEALIRQLGAALSLITAAFGLAKATGYLNVIVSLATPIATVITLFTGVGFIVWGQINTRFTQKRFIVAAEAAPNKVAVVK